MREVGQGPAEIFLLQSDKGLRSQQKAKSGLQGMARKYYSECGRDATAFGENVVVIATCERKNTKGGSQCQERRIL